MQAAVTQVAEVIVTAGAVVAALAGMTRLRPVRWLGRTLVHDPMTRWHRAVTVEVIRAVVPGIVDDRLQHALSRPDVDTERRAAQLRHPSAARPPTPNPRRDT